MNISEEIARKDFENWVSPKKLPKKKLEENAEHADVIIDGIMDGSIVINEDNTLTLNLIWPTTEDENGVSKLEFKKHRMKFADGQRATKGLKPDDADGRLLAFVSFLTDQPVGVIKNLAYGSDLTRASSITVYFL